MDFLEHAGMIAEDGIGRNEIMVRKNQRSFNLKTAVGGEFFLTQRRREAENAEKIANL